jgi:dolichol-phosphate mannosyltransferase
VNERDAAQTAVSHPSGLLTVIVPTRNEAQNIRPLLERLAAALAEVPIEVLFMDDSTDNTPEAIAQAAPYFPFPVRVIARPPERRNGLSGAVVEGFQAAQGEWLCVMDADLQHPPEVLPVLLARAQEARADIVVGSRKADIFGPLGLSRKRAMTSQLLTLLARAWFPRLLKNVSDPLTGLFLVRRAALNTAVLRPDGFKILLEILIRCPGLRVSEVQFDFASRHEGESKADFQEGMRFFRHLLRLRLTANQSFPRLVAVAVGSLLLDVAAFAGLYPRVEAPFWLTAVLLAELILLLRYYAIEHWVLGRGHAVPGWPSLRRFWLTNQLSLFAARLPLLYLLFARWDWPAVPAITLAVLVESALRYALSEQWVFSRRGVTMWQPGGYRYDIHGLLRLESQIPLPELAYFATPEPLPHVDVQIRIDRHGTPSPQPGAIIYNEGLSRFGFGLAVMPGAAYTEVVISPLLAHSPYALYKSVLEPIVRWALAQRGAALLYGAAVARQGQAALLVPEQDQGKTAAALRAAREGFDFMGDDFVI